MTMAAISPKKLSGTIKAPPSKSELHRAIICAALSNSTSTIYPVELSNDVLATINGVKALGAHVKFVEGKLLIRGDSIFSNANAIVDCVESASTLRFLIPLVGLKGNKVKFIGSKGLFKRPIDCYLDVLPKQGLNIEQENNTDFSLKVKGILKSGKFILPGNISSQFVTGLLLTLPLLKSDSEIVLTTPLESSGYVELTLDVMKKFSVFVEKTKTGFFIKGNQKYKACDYKIEGDWSSAAMWLLAGALGSDIEVKGLNIDSKQPDKNILSIMSRVGAKIKFLEDSLKVSKGDLKSTEIYSAQFPDIVPILSVLAAKSMGLTKIWGASRLKIKESNRLEAIYGCLKNMGVKVDKTDDGLLISGHSFFKASRLDSFSDHRIVMAMAIAGTVAEGRIIIKDAQSIRKSYPEFFEDFEKLGGLVNVISLD